MVVTILQILVSLAGVILGIIGFLWVVVRANDPSDPEHVKAQILCYVLFPLSVSASLILYLNPDVAAYVRATIYRQRRREQNNAREGRHRRRR